MVAHERPTGIERKVGAYPGVFGDAITAAMSAARPVGVAMGASGRTSMRCGEGESFASSRFRNFRMMFMP